MPVSAPQGCHSQPQGRRPAREYRLIINRTCHAASRNAPSRTRQWTGLELELSSNRPLGSTHWGRVALVKLMARSPTASSTLVRFRSSGPMTHRRTGTVTVASLSRYYPFRAPCM